MSKGAVTFLVLIHFAVLVVHGAAHIHLSIAASKWQKSFIVIIIFVGPLVATTLLWSRRPKLGTILLGLSSAGSLAFGASYHFLIAGPDNAIGPVHSDWTYAFRASAVVLGVIEAAGIIWCLQALRSGLSREIN